ncbi:DNA helicase [Clostridia bacterium]|nr:DNA helicase [Clostridia bacterium]
MTDYSKLNPAQNEAVFSESNRILCLAGAGTGKTQVLTRRVARLYELNYIDPANMLCLTFTRAAGAEMKERVIGLIGDDGKKLFCNTFHAFCLELIREQCAAIGYEPNISIYDQTDCAELLKEITADLRIKISAKSIADVRRGKGDRVSANERKDAERVLKELAYRMKRSNAIDLDGLIPTASALLESREDIRQFYRERYTHVFVDEFQDTDSGQWKLVNDLLSPEKLFIVGDDFQAIYGFRGSDITIILGLADNSEWHTVKLEQNYRSTKQIITAANALIKFNTQTEKVLISDKDGAEIEFREPEDDRSEIYEIADRLKANIKAGIKTAILTRTNKQIALARDILNDCNIPCATTSGEDNPFSSAEAKELLAWIAAIDNINDDVAMRKIAAPRISKTDLLKAEKDQLQADNALYEMIEETVSGKQFAELYNDVSESFRRDFAENDNLTEAIGRIITRLVGEGIRYIYPINRWEEKQRELGEPNTPKDFLEWVQLCNIAEKPAKERTAEQIHVMTVHGSKGLEFDEVFIIGAVQGTFPGRGNLEEERRLFYVAITRARERLNISSPLAMVDFSGNLMKTERSRFIDEAGIGEITAICRSDAI